MTKIRKMSIDGVNEKKYEVKYNHKFRDVLIHPGNDEMIKRGIDKISKAMGLIINCLCSLDC